MKNKEKQFSIVHSLIGLLRKYPFIILILIALALSISWFSSHKLIASGEEGIFFNNPGLTIHLFLSPWYEVATGMPMPVVLPRVTLLFLPYILTNILVFPSWISQAMIVFLLLCSGLVGMYFLARHFLKDFSNQLTYLSVAIFYLFNLYTLSQIIGRLLFTGIALWGYLPLFLLFYIYWVEKKKLIYLFLFLLSSFVFSYAYGMPSNVIVLWVPAFIWTIVRFIHYKFDFRLLLDTTFTISLWTAINIWWIWPYIKLSNSAFTTIVINSSSLDSLKGVSTYFPSSQIFLLRQLFLFQNTYFGWYNQPWVVLISVSVVFIVGLGVFRSFGRKFWTFFLSLFLVGWFVSKGTNFPLGRTFFYLVFTKLTFMQVFRNSYEKFGIIFMIPYSFFFALGIESIGNNVFLFRKFKSIIFIGSIVLFCFILSWPLITGTVFGAGMINTQISVPGYYEQANRFINSKGRGKILMLPMVQGDGIKYIWPNGNYQGIEPSEVLFDHPAISKIVRSNLVDDKYTQLYNAMINNQPYTDIFTDMSIRYIVLHNDIDSKVSGASSSAQMKLLIEKNDKVTYLKSFGKLDVYEFLDPKSGKLIDITPSDSANISYKELSNTHYSISIKNATNPYMVFFKETFNPLWVARIDKNIVKDHSMIYGYANGWKVTKLGSYTIDLVFKIWPWE